MSANKADSVSEDAAIIILESDDDDGDDKTDEVVFVSSTPAIISSSDSEDDDIVVIAHTTRKKPPPPSTSDAKTEQAVQSILGSETNNIKSEAGCKIHPFIEATDKSAGRAPPPQREDEDDILKAIRSIATGLEQSSAGSTSASASSTSISTGSSTDCLLTDDPFGSSDFALDPLGSFSGKHPWSDLAQTVSDSNKSSASTDVVQYDISDSKSGGRGGKSSLKRSLSSGCTSSSSVPLKKRPLYATASTSDLPSIEAAVGASEDVECLTCLVNFDNTKLSKCIQGHPCCSDCLQKRAKRILAQERKGTIRCTVTGCESFFSIGELRRSLPAIIVEILEERLETDQINTVASLANELFDDNGKLVHATSSGATSGSDDYNNAEAGDSDSQDSMDFGKTVNGLPIHWEQMDPDQPGYKAVNLEGGSDEYQRIAVQFHDTMSFPRADIKSVKRVQNPILWQFYSVKRKQMAAANNGRPVLEKQLFHGTSAESLDPICRNGFDWRLCGTHGTMYGQGSYFAKDASYSHRYTGLGRYGRFGSWNQPHQPASSYTSASALIQKKLRNQRAMLRHVMLRRKIHSQLQQPHSPLQQSLATTQQQPPSYTQSVLNVMRFNRRQFVQPTSTTQPDVVPLAQQQQQQQQQQDTNLASVVSTPWHKVKQPSGSRLQVVIPQAHTHSSSTPPWHKTSYFSSSDPASGFSNNSASSSSTTSSSVPQMNVVQPAAHSSSVTYTSMDQMGAQPPMAHMASTPQPTVRPTSYSAAAVQTNNTAIPQSPSSPSSSISSASSSPTVISAPGLPSSSGTSSTSAGPSSSSSTGTVSSVGTSSPSSVNVPTSATASSSSGKVFSTLTSSSSDSSDDDYDNGGSSSDSGVPLSPVLPPSHFRLKKNLKRLKDMKNLKQKLSVLKSSADSNNTSLGTPKPIVIAPIDSNRASSTATVQTQSTTTSMNAQQANQLVASLGLGTSVMFDSVGNITVNQSRIVAPQCKAPQCPPPVPAHNSQNNNQTGSFTAALPPPPPAHMNMPTFMNPLTLAPPPIQLHHGAFTLPPVNVPPSFSSTTRFSVPMDDTEKIHTMFVSRVLVGCYTAGNASLRKPPPLDPTQPYGKAYDTCVDNVYDPKVFVVFDSAQCYPEYIVEYTNNTGYIDI